MNGINDLVARLHGLRDEIGEILGRVRTCADPKCRAQFFAASDLKQYCSNRCRSRRMVELHRRRRGIKPRAPK